MSQFTPKTFCLTFLPIAAIFPHYAIALPRILDFDSTTTTEEPAYVVSWSVDKLLDRITFDVSVATTGFIGLGFSPGGGMTGADIVVGWVDDVTGLGHLEDRHGVGQTTPVMDVSQDYTLVLASQNSTHTNMRFSRALDTCDTEGDVPITADTIKLIWSYGLTDNLEYHAARRGQRSVNLLDPVLPEKPDLSRYKVWEMRTNKTMPAERTTYWCTIHRPPPLEGKHHVVGFDAILDGPVSAQHTHHMEAYKCTLPPGQESHFDSYLDQPGHDCYYPTDPDFPGHHCEHIAYGWAIGGELTLFPSFVGFPLEAGEYFKLEVHYDNPQLLSGVQFETGLKLYYTDELREIDAGRFVIGSEVNFTQSLPPNSVEFTTVAHCSASCTGAFPPEGVTLFNFLLHSHLSGRQMKIRHFRARKELPWAAVDANYDFNYQATRSFAQPIQLLPGDHLALECVYDSRWKEGAAVIGGRATTDEMCMAFLSYYPRVEGVLSCGSEPPKESVLGILDLAEVEFEHSGDTDPIVVSPLPLRGLHYSKVLEMVPWDTSLRAEYQEFVRHGPHSGYCRPASGGAPVEELWTYPDYEEAYKPPNTCRAVQ